MNIAGIDFSSHAIDVVTVPLDQGAPVWTRYELHGQDAFERARSVADAMPGPSSVLWDEVLAVGIEHPAGKHGVGPLLRIQGAILSRIPARMLVVPLPPGKWRKLVGLPGNAGKETVARHSTITLTSALGNSPEWQQAVARWPWTVGANGPDGEWPQDAHDAHLIALATRTLLAQQHEAAA